IVVIYSATRGPGGDRPVVTTFLERQAVFAAIGVALMGVVMAVDFRHLREILPALYVGVVGLLCAVLVIGVETNGAKAWFRTPLFNVQPSEFGKLVLIVSLAVLFANGPEVPSLGRVLGS